MKKFILGLIALSVLFFQTAIAANFFPHPLIQADWLAQNLSDDVVILDTRKELETFTQEGHIENAVLVDVKKIRLARTIDGKEITRMRPAKADFEAFMQQHGVNTNSKIVITHRGQTPGQVAGAARLYWHMKTYHVADVALLDGGNAAWVAALEELVTETTPVTKGNYQVTSENTALIADMQQVQQALKQKDTVLIDTRGLRYHIGVDKKSYVYAYGHIPTSKVVPYKVLNPLKGMAVYWPKEKLSQIMHDLNIELDKGKILYCNSAYECSSVWFVLSEILGSKNTRIFDGSLHQWTQYPENPMTTSF